MYAMIRVLTNKMASAWANTTSTSGRIYGIQLVAGGSIVAQDVPTNGGAPPDLVGHLLTWWGLGPTRPTRRYATVFVVFAHADAILLVSVILAYMHTLAAPDDDIQRITCLKFSDNRNGCHM